MDERQSSNFIRLLPTHKLSCNGMLEQNQMWRRRVGVENNTVRNLKDLEGMLGNTKSLNAIGNTKEFLLFPQWPLAFVSKSEVPPLYIPPTLQIVRSALGPNFVARMASRPPNLSKE